MLPESFEQAKVSDFEFAINAADYMSLAILEIDQMIERGFSVHCPVCGCNLKIGQHLTMCPMSKAISWAKQWKEHEKEFNPNTVS